VWLVLPEHTRLDPSMWIAATKPPTLADLQGAVGGYVETVDFGDGCLGWLNEEGKLDGLPINRVATELCRLHQAIALDDYIAGPMVITVGRACPD
jgi:hypothetical protein